MLTVNLSEKTENWLKSEAARRGIDAPSVAAEILENALPKSDETDPTIALMRQWMAEDATDDPEELEKQRLEGEEFMQNLAQNRFDMEGPNARKLWP